MGKYLAHIDKTDKLQIIRDVNFDGTVLYSAHIWQTQPIFDKLQWKYQNRASAHIWQIPTNL